LTACLASGFWNPVVLLRCRSAALIHAAANIPLPPYATRSPHPQAAALIGAVVTGVLARRRRVETQTLNDKLRQINAELRRQREQQVRFDGCACWSGRSC